MSDKPHISHSQLSMYWRCPEQYRRRYLEGQTLPPGIALMTGTAIHRAAETNFEQKVESHEDLPVNQIVDAAAYSFDMATKGGYALSEDETSIGREKVLGAAFDVVACLAQVHATQQAPDYQPLEVEKLTRIVFPHATHDLLAVTDLRDDQHRVTDIKTAARRKPQTEVDGSVQLTIYAAAYSIDHGRQPNQVRLDSLIKTKKPGRQVLISTRDHRDYQVLVHRINVTLSAIEAGLFPPCVPDSWQCSDRWCGFWRTCPYVNSERLLKAAEKGE